VGRSTHLNDAALLPTLFTRNEKAAKGTNTQKESGGLKTEHEAVGISKDSLLTGPL
jgi:hypothetical protein